MRDKATKIMRRIRTLRFMSDITKWLFEPVRPRLHGERIETGEKQPEVTDQQKAECLDHLEQAWRIHMLLQQQYDTVPLEATVERFTRSTIGHLSQDFPWLQRETKLQVLAMIFAAIIRSGNPSETETREAIKQIWPRLLEEVHWP
jgi:hypothetical protein